MRPYPVESVTDESRLFNYQLSHVECAFGIMVAKRKKLNRWIDTNVQHAIDSTKAICILHNYVLTHNTEHPVLEGQATVLLRFV